MGIVGGSQSSVLPKQCTVRLHTGEVAARPDGKEGADIPPKPVPGLLLSLGSSALMEHEFALSKTWSLREQGGMNEAREM